MNHLGIFPGDEKGEEKKLYNRKRKAHDRYDDNGMGFSNGFIKGKNAVPSQAWDSFLRSYPWQRYETWIVKEEERRRDAGHGRALPGIALPGEVPCMQPMMVVASPVPGILYINGRFAGEISAARPAIAPVSPWGAIYLEYRPLEPGAAAMARKCVFSGGRLMTEGLEDAAGLFCMTWPGGVAEIELAPEAEAPSPVTLGDRTALFKPGEGAYVEWAGRRVPLPEDAEAPRLEAMAGFSMLRGTRRGSGEYLVLPMADGAATLEGQRIEFDGRDMLTNVVGADDLVGHGWLEQWLIDASGLSRVSSEPVWQHGAPRWPRTPEETLRAAVEAALAGQSAEANGYFAAAAARDDPLAAIGEVCDLCVPMKYAPPDARAAVGLARLENARCAVVRPLYYRVSPGGGLRGPWQIDWISLE